MKAIVDSQKLSKNLKDISAAIKKTTVIPILSCVKLDFEKDSLTITATDLESTIIMTMAAECKKPFSIVLEHSEITGVSAKTYNPITINDEEGAVLITSEDGDKFKFTKSHDASSFPAIPEEDFLLDVEADTEFFEALSAATQCRATDEFKPSFNMACVDVKKEWVSIVGTDAFVLFNKKINGKNKAQRQAMIPDQFAYFVKSFRSGIISIGEKFVRCKSENVIIISRLSDAKFCNYEMLLNSELNWNFKANGKEFISKLDKINVATNKASHLCTVTFTKTGVKLTSEDIDFGREAEADLKAAHTVDFSSIGVNANQLLKILKLMDAEEVEFSFSSPTRSIYMRPEGDQNIICLLQPLMTNN